MNKIIQDVEHFAKKFCKQDPEDPKLWETHIQLVRKFALQLAEIEGADKEVVEIAALLHDIGKYKGRKEHNVRSYEMSKEFLKDVEIPKKDLILKCILKHSTKYSSEDNEIEVKVVQCADALATLFDDEWQEFSRQTMEKEVLRGLYDKSLKKINLESARKIAEPQIKKLKYLMEENK